MTAPRQHRPTRPLSALVCFSALSIVQSALNLLLLPLYVRFVTPAEYGVLATVTIVAAIVSVASNLKLDAAMRTFYFDYADDPDGLEAYLRQTFSASLYFAIVVYAAMLLAGPALFRLVFVHEELRFFPAGALALATASIGACLAPYFVYLRNSLSLLTLVRWQAALVAGTVACQVVLIVGFGLGLYGVLLGSLLPAATTLLLLCLSRPGLLTTRLDWRLLAPSLRYTVPLLGLGLCQSLGTRLDRLVLERHIDLDSLGSYAIVAGLLGLLTVVLNTLDNVVRPYLYPGMRSAARRAGPSATSPVSREPRRDRPAALGGTDAYQRLYLVAGLLALSFAVFIGSNLQLVTSNPAYVSAQRWLPLGATAFAPMVLTRYYALYYDLHKRSVALSTAVILRIAVTYLLLVAFVPTFGIGGALLAILFAETLNALIFGFTVRRLFAVDTTLRTVALQLALFLGVLWSLHYAVGGKSVAVFGALQLLVTAVTLLGANRRAVRALLAADGPAQPLVAPRAP